MATRAFDILKMKHRELLDEEFRQIPGFEEQTLAKARQIVRLLALLHDVGHPAFSHAAESALPGGNSHEDLSAHVIRNVLGGMIDSMLFAGAAELLVRALQKSPEVIFLRQFVAGEMDMDRTDYLLRDSLHCGVEYGKFDFHRLLESLTVLKHPDTGRLQIGIERGGEHTFEGLILVRYQMNTQVYYHRIRRIYDHYLMEYMGLWGKEHYKTLDDVLQYDDFKVLVEIDKDAKANNERTAPARRILSRRHHKVVYETGDNADAIQLKKTKRILLALQEQFPEADFYLDDAKGSIHKVSMPGQQEASKVEDFFIVERDGALRLIGEQSAILPKIPTEFRSVRIFADETPAQMPIAGFATPTGLERIREAARKADRG